MTPTPQPLQQDSSEHILQFASLLSPGPPSEAAQTLKWIYSVQGADLFTSLPELSVAGAEGLVHPNLAAPCTLNSKR